MSTEDLVVMPINKSFSVLISNKQAIVGIEGALVPSNCEMKAHLYHQICA